MQRTDEKPNRKSSLAQGEIDSVDRSGGAILALLQQAADAAKGDCDRALATARQLSLQLRVAEDRADKLRTKVNQLEDDARKAEQWLAQIQKEIENRFFHQTELRIQRS